MAMDRIGPSFGMTSSAGYGGSGAQRSIVQPQGAQPMSFGDSPMLGATIGAARGWSDTSLSQLWGEKFVRWGGREAAAQVFNTAIATKVPPAPPPPPPPKQGVFKKLFSKKSAATSATVTAAAAPLKTYSDWFHLGNKSIAPREFSQFGATVKHNLKDVKQNFTAENAKNWTKASTWKTYGRETVVQNNFKPIKDLVTNSPNKDLGAGLSRVAGFGLLGFDVAKNVKNTYDHAQAREDGSTQSKIETYKETAEAAAKYTARAGILWEVAGVGMAVGKAVLPVALRSIPVGGILMGALFAATGQKLLDPLLKTGTHDPNKKEKAPAETTPMPAASAS